MKGSGMKKMPMKRMKAGGVTSAEMKKYGRNVARAMNQKSPTKPGKG
jgi:hypothetical protein